LLACLLREQRASGQNHANQGSDVSALAVHGDALHPGLAIPLLGGGEVPLFLGDDPELVMATERRRSTLT
jgi:hypothetical protein